MMKKKAAAAALLALALLLAVPGVTFAADSSAASGSAVTKSTKTVQVKTTGEGVITLKAAADTVVTTTIPGEEQYNMNNHFLDHQAHFIGFRITDKTPKTYTVSGDISDVSFCPVGGRAVTAGSTVLVGTRSTEGIEYEVDHFTFKAPSDGWIKVIPSGFEKGDEPYFNSQLALNGKNISSSDLFDTFPNSASPYRAYGVRKGLNYTIRIKPAETLFPVFAYKFRVTFKSVPSSRYHSSKKAKAMKAKKKYKGTIAAGSKTQDWYKFKVKKRKSIDVTVFGETNNSLNVVVRHKYKGKTHKYIAAISPYSYGRKKIHISAKKYTGISTKGTWTVQVCRANRGSSGYYELSWR